MEKTRSCCGSKTGLSVDLSDEPKAVGTKLSVGDRLTSLLVRLAFRRSGFRVEPGLYSVGTPDADSPVFVSANYALSFDKLRTSLTGMSAYILTLDTKGINVWCAAGKGTFGTEELVARIRTTGLANRVGHKKIILPQLGAPGIEAHKVKKQTGFSVIYGPVRASDIPEFMRLGCVAKPEMRIVSFGFKDRLVLTGVELVQGLKFALLAIPVFIIIGFIRDKGVHVDHLAGTLPFFGSVVAGAFITPVMLPWIPGKAFSFKGWLAGLIVAALISFLSGASAFSWGANLLTFPALSAFICLNFTGASTYTSLSGVIKEMRFATPLIAISFCAGILMTIVGFFHFGGIV